VCGGGGSVQEPLREVARQQATFCTRFAGSEIRLTCAVHFRAVSCPPGDASSSGGRLVQRQAESWVSGPLGDQQPEHDDQRHEEEESGQELLVRVLWGPRGRCRVEARVN